MILNTGAQRIAWRYDPVLVTPTYSVERHLETFEYLSSRLAGHVDRCIFSFVERYKKLETNMPELQEVSDADKERLREIMRRTTPLRRCLSERLVPMTR